MASRWICCQIGAREHYAIPRVLHGNGRLTALYTDFWAGRLVRSLGATGAIKVARSLASRFHPELARAPVISQNTRSLLSEIAGGRRRGENPYLRFIRVGEAFSTSVRGQLRQRSPLNGETIFFSYDTGALEAMQYCRDRGVRCVLGQMDPNRVEVDLVRDEEKQWPGWSIQPLSVPEAYFRRREQEWALADIVLVNSEFCRQALLQQGVPDSKLAVIPLSFEAGALVQKQNPEGRTPDRPLRVLYLGQVILRKGIQYLMQAARMLEDEPIQFDVVGPVGISESAVASAPRNMTFHGRATRDQTAAWYRQSHVFVLPTLSDGFALTQLEAMSFGLPVVATPCCGAVVQDGTDGFIVAPRDAEALAGIFRHYLLDENVLPAQRLAAFEKVKLFGPGRLGRDLETLEHRLNA